MTTDFSKASQQPSQLSSKNKSGLPVCIMANLFLDKRLQSIVCKGGGKKMTRSMYICIMLNKQFSILGWCCRGFFCFFLPPLHTWPAELPKIPSRNGEQWTIKREELSFLRYRTLWLCYRLVPGDAALRGGPVRREGKGREKDLN